MEKKKKKKKKNQAEIPRPPGLRFTNTIQTVRTSPLSWTLIAVHKKYYRAGGKSWAGRAGRPARTPSADFFAPQNEFGFSPVRFKWSENRLERTLTAPFLVTAKFHIFNGFLGLKLISSIRNGVP